MTRHTFTGSTRLRLRPLGRAAVSCPDSLSTGGAAMDASVQILPSARSKQTDPTPLTSEPPLADAAPLTSEPPLADAAPLTSEPTAPGTAGGTESPGV
ncbi:hypothetical protein [Streptomyces lushanensis]|uniref:hypothetical protein n=1 Tax=Streptomyces lushanensis TaxID=1434255 RepID=UPI003CCC4304